MAVSVQESRSARFAMRCASWAERWFPDSWVFAALAVVLVCLGAMVMGAKPTDTAKAASLGIDPPTFFFWAVSSRGRRGGSLSEACIQVQTSPEHGSHICLRYHVAAN